MESYLGYTKSMACQERMYAGKSEAEGRLAAMEAELSSTFQELEKDQVHSPLLPFVSAS